MQANILSLARILSEKYRSAEKGNYFCLYPL